ncbi:DeoR/GlpR family DNA-binding transcription regulator [Cytobacillus kochii]|uniref:DeoR/GlpR family DNA-binding transcription regulator n=1 Tax=Cytobacillus kochii TaxID=859143 RepID=UPI002040138E|nr:DeoR/GlpR family DNA-binding transcription regulator [Cytobacillus kochii]MCM3321253.1 DeoR/GlpR family DNA-binding transcription regulator [Cytobacillus kochii]MCM3343913.1 DeoR/GlpR family DNA-binding transcription regulator [Cytobacillus kochii]
MSLLAEERKKKIMSLIQEFGQVKVNQLAKEFHVSTETIRRYLEELSNEYKIKKVHGGAVKVEPVNNELSMFEREILHIEEKKLIGKKAATLVEDGDVLFIDEGSTTMQMADGLLMKEGITVITNSFPIAIKLMEREELRSFTGELIFLGGHVRNDHFRTTGSLAEKMAKEFYVDKAFIAIDGVANQAGFTSYDLDKCLLSQVFISQSKKSYVLSDDSKVDKVANYKIASLEEVNYFITNIDYSHTVALTKEQWIQS